MHDGLPSKSAKSSTFIECKVTWKKKKITQADGRERRRMRDARGSGERGREREGGYAKAGQKAQDKA